MKNRIKQYLTYVLPWIFIIVGIWAFFQITSFRYAKAINFVDWLFSGSENIELTLRDVNIVMGVMKRTIFTRVFWIVWFIGFSVSVINLGYYIHNKKQDYAPNCEIVDKEPHKKMRGIIKCYEGCLLKYNKSKVLKNLNLLAEQLYYESDFGYGSAEIIEYENAIYSKICFVENILENIASGLEENADIWNSLDDTIRHINILMDERAEAKKRH